MPFPVRNQFVPTLGVVEVGIERGRGRGRGRLGGRGEKDVRRANSDGRREADERGVRSRSETSDAWVGKMGSTDHVGRCSKQGGRVVTESAVEQYSTRRDAKDARSKEDKTRNVCTSGVGGTMGSGGVMKGLILLLLDLWGVNHILPHPI